jgi:hypothetical protein
MKKDKKSLYIIGDIPKFLNDETIDKFKIAELDMMAKGFKVYNPIVNVKMNSRRLNQELKIKNIQNLFKCDAVYILPCALINQSNVELPIAMILDLFIIHGLDLRKQKSKKENSNNYYK